MACCRTPNSQNPCREPWNKGKIVGQKARFKTWCCSTSALRSMSAPGWEQPVALDQTTGCYPTNPVTGTTNLGYQKGYLKLAVDTFGFLPKAITLVAVTLVAPTETFIPDIVVATGKKKWRTDGTQRLLERDEVPNPSRTT